MQTNGSGDRRIIRMGVIGIGGGAAAMVPVFANHPGFRWTAAADLDPQILERFSRDYEVETYTSAEALCEDPGVDAVYIATPNRWHKPHALMALNNKKHVLSEKPMTIRIEDADEMIEAADRNGVFLAVNVKHSFERRVLKLRDLVTSGALGRLRLMNYSMYNDWLYRPRTPEELTPEWGGGVPWRQGPHQIDILRTIGGGLVQSLRGTVGVWDESRRVAGMYSAYLNFADGAVAMALYSGYDHLSSGVLMRGITNRGPIVPPERYARARKEFAGSPEAEAAAAAAERYGGSRGPGGNQQGAGPPQAAVAGGGGGGWMSGGPFILSFDHADVWVQPDGLLVCDDEKQEEIALPNVHGDGRWGRVHSFYESLIKDEPPPADGRWGRATLEVILKIFESSEQRREVALTYQTPTDDAGLAAVTE